MSKLVQVKKVIADGTGTSVLLDGIDSNEIYYFTVAGATHNHTGTDDGIIHAHDGISNVTTNYEGVSHGWRSDTTDSINDMSSSANSWRYSFAWGPIGSGSSSITAPDTANADGYLFNFYDSSEYSYIKTRFANAYTGGATLLGGNSAGVIKNLAQYTGISFSWLGGYNITGEFTLFKLLES